MKWSVSPPQKCLDFLSAKVIKKIEIGDMKQKACTKASGKERRKIVNGFTTEIKNYVQIQSFYRSAPAFLLTAED